MAATAMGRIGNPLSYLWKKTWRYSEGNRKTIAWFSAMFIAAESLIIIAQPLIKAAMMNIVQADLIRNHGLTWTSVEKLLWLLALIPLVRVAFWALHGPARVMERCNAFTARANYRKFLQKGMMTLPMDWHVEHHSGDTTDKMSKGTEALYDFSGETFVFIYAAVDLAVSFGVLTYVSHPSALIVLAMICITVWIITRFDRVLIRWYERLNHTENAVAESVIDAITNIATVIILRVEWLVFRAIARKIDLPYELFKKTVRLEEIKWFVMAMCCVLMVVFVLGAYFLGHVGSTHMIKVGDLYLLYAYLDQVSELFFAFCARYSEVLQRASRLMNAEELTADFRAENFTNHVLPGDWRELRVKHLSFSYGGDGGDDPHLDNLSFSIARGQRVALVGESGSGKTTLLKIMRNLYHPQEITLLVDGAEVPQGFEGICRAITLVPQDPELFSKTIFENITVGAEHDSAFVRRFTDMASLTDVIDGLPNGFDSFIKEKGVNLSGGQRQRLALARGLLACHDKDLVLLDEPTSSVDAANEMRIYQNIFREFNGKTIVSSVHHLHLLPFFDVIHFMDGGKIITSGNLNDLLLHCPEFQMQWQQYHSREREVMA